MKKVITILIVLAVLIGIGIYVYMDYRKQQEMLYPKFYSGNGRLEATEVYISSKLPGRIEKIYKRSGDLVHPGEKLVQMKTDSLEAEKASYLATIKVKEGELAMAKANVKMKQSVFNGAEKEWLRNKSLRASNAVSQKDYDQALTAYEKALADLEYAKAQVIAAEGSVEQQKANVNRVQTDINDSLLISNIDGRIQYRLAHEGEVLSAGGRALNVVDLTDVYLTFFLPTKIAGQVQMGAEVKLIFDAVPDFAFDAKVSFIDPVAQFTPKSVETQVEREKLMFRVKAQLDAEILRKYIDSVKTGLPGVAYVKLDPKADWKDSSITDVIASTEVQMRSAGADSK